MVVWDSLIGANEEFRSVRPSSFIAVVIASLAAWVSPAAAQDRSQDFPSRPIRMIVAFAAGGTTDFVARLIADKAKGALGQNIVVENKPGANGAIGADYVAKSSPTATPCSSRPPVPSRSTPACGRTCRMTR
jgi:tripartite-type tricarboxylate transporter receptor subunit TctC